MMEIKLKSRNFQKLQRFSAFSAKPEKSEQIPLKSAKIATKLGKNCKLFSMSNGENVPKKMTTFR